MKKKLTLFEELKDIVGILRPHEAENAKKLFMAFNRRIKAGNSRSLKLLNILLTSPGISKQEALRKMGNPNIFTFNSATRKLKEYLLEALLLNINIQKKEAYSDYYRTYLELRKKIMQALILKGRGLDDTAYNFYDQIISEAKKYELYEESLIMLYNKQWSQSLRTGQEFFEKTIPEIEFHERCRMAFNKALNWYTKYYIEVDVKGIKGDKISILTEAIADLQEEYRYTGSASVGFYLYLLMMEYYLVQEDYVKSCKTGLKLVSLINNNPSVFVKRRLAMVYSDLADNELFIFDFNSSVEHSKKAQELLPQIDYNHQVAREIEFRARFYLRDFDRAMSIIQDLLKEDQTAFLSQKRTYLLACLLFVKGEYRKCWGKLHGLKELEKDAEGWNIGFRVLNIMTLLEQNKNDPAEKNIEAMRRHITRIRELKPLRKRDKLILRLLVQLDKHSYFFDKVWEKERETIQQLDQAQRPYCWEVKTPEMIVFHKWFEAKAKGEQYQFAIPDSLFRQQEKMKKEEEKDPFPFDLP